jgi:poly-gamma-glutamate synthesis protein (capsule biosynthesis protein)
VETSLVFAGDYYPGGENCLQSFGHGRQLVANLECSLYSSRNGRSKAHAVCVNEEQLAEQTFSRFVALNVANNHVLDSGLSAFRGMLDILVLRKHVAVYGTTQNPYAVVSLGGQRCAIIGCLERCRARGDYLFREEDVTTLVRALRNNFDWIFVTPHWGKHGELAHFPSPQQLSRARAWIDAGVDGVLGHHSHTVQGREVVSGRPVYYSLGNLWFPQAQSQDCSASRLSLLVEVVVKPPEATLRWSERFLWRQNDYIAQVSDVEHLRCAEFLSVLSEPLQRHWTWLKWARAIGDIYIRQSSESWRQRITRYGWPRTLPLIVAWNLHPVTWLLRLGRLVPDRLRAQEVACSLAAIASSAERMHSLSVANDV